MKTGSTCDDVGIQMTATNVRRASTLNKRIAKGGKRAPRTRALVVINPAAIKLTMSGTHPVQAYGHQAQGASWAQQGAMRKNIKNTTPFAGSRACTATVISWIFGPTSDPHVKIPLEQIDMWMKVWAETTTEQRHDTRYTWQRHLSSYIGSGRALRSMGPDAATINATLQAGWRPARPD